MSTILLSLGLLIKFSAIGDALAGSFLCSNAPASRWGNYFCISGGYDHYTDRSRQAFVVLSDVTFGICAGSTEAGAEDQVNVIELEKVPVDFDLSASSAEWRLALPFDLTSDELGKAILYVKPETFVQGSGVARLKAQMDGRQKDVRLNCSMK